MQSFHVSVSHADTSDHASVLICVNMETGLLGKLQYKVSRDTIGR